MTDAETISSEASEQRWRFVRVGALTAAALTVLLTLVYLLTAGGSEIFATRTILRTYLGDSTGLNKGSSVRLSGIPIGKIKELHLSGSTDPRRIIMIEMKVDTKYLADIPEDSAVGIDAANILGDKYINIDEGKSPRPVQPGGELKSAPPSKDLLNQADLLATLQSNLKRVDDLLSQIESGNTRVGKFFQGEEFYQKVRAQITAIQTAIVTLDSPKSELGKSLFTNQMYERLSAPIADLDNLLAGMQRGEGPVGQLLNDSSLYDNARKSIAEIQGSLGDIEQGKGPLGTFVKSDQTYAQWKKLADTLEQIIDSVNAGEGQLGHLLANAQLYESLNGSTHDLQLFLADLRANPQKYLRLKVF